MSDPRSVAAEVARRSYGRLIALLSATTGDISLAEDALAEAFARALQKWTTPPSNPEAWLLTVARNIHRDRRKSAAERTRTSLEDAPEASVGPKERLLEEALLVANEDRRLKLLFVCAHPAIAESVRTPLMLQTVLGLDAALVANLYCMPAATLSQRLVRAKRKIRDSKIPFRIPDGGELEERLPFVLEAIYGAYALDWTRADSLEEDLRGEALFLASLVCETLAVPEALGLFSLLAFSAARQPARFDLEGAVIALEEQEMDRWHAPLFRAGERALAQASMARTPGRFQLEAAIQAAHMSRRRTGVTPWKEIAALYDGLLSFAPTRGALVARAAALLSAHGPDAALRSLEGNLAELQDFQPYWATLAHARLEMGEIEEAKAALGRAISLCTEHSLRLVLERKLESLRTL